MTFRTEHLRAESSQAGLYQPKLERLTGIQASALNAGVLDKRLFNAGEDLTDEKQC